MQIIIRDDDTSYFTTPEMLQKVYQTVWDLHIPVCLSVIPAYLTCELKQQYIRQKLGSHYDINVPLAHRGTNESFFVSDNNQLCSFLNKMIDDQLVDIAIHGYSHADELESLDENEIKKTINKSLALLRSSFPSATLNTVVPPYEILTPLVYKILLESNYNISVGYENFRTNSCVDRLRHLAYRIRKKFITDVPRKTVQFNKLSKIFFGMSFFEPDRPPSQCLEKAIQVFDECKKVDKTFICTNHYHYFFEDWTKPKEDLLSAWFEFIKYTTSSKVKWTTFAQHS